MCHLQAIVEAVIVSSKNSKLLCCKLQSAAIKQTSANNMQGGSTKGDIIDMAEMRKDDVIEAFLGQGMV